MRRVGGALRFVAPMRIDGDGGRHTYRIGSGGLDYIGNAHADPHDLSSRWVGVVLGRDGKPIADSSGFLVSPTALCDVTKDLDDPARYVDAEIVPYGSMPPELEGFGAKLGDVGLAEYRGKSVAIIWADVGPHRKLGEASEACAKALGIPSSPKNGGVDAPVVTYTLWTDTRTTPPWSRTLDSIASQVASLRAALPPGV